MNKMPRLIKTVIASALLIPLSGCLPINTTTENHAEQWVIKWVHTKPANHPTRDIVLTQTGIKTGTYIVRFNNGVDGTVSVEKSSHEFHAQMILNQSAQLPSGDTCRLNGTILNNIVKGIWVCKSKHRGTLTGIIKTKPE
jgi:hypothetical protein